MLRGTWEVGRTVSAGRHSLTHSLTQKALKLESHNALKLLTLNRKALNTKALEPEGLKPQTPGGHFHRPDFITFNALAAGLWRTAWFRG